MSDELHAKLLHILMNEASLEDRAHLVNFEDERRVLKAAYICGNKEKDVAVVLNLPTISDKVFVTVTDGEPEKVASIMSHLEEVDATRSKLDFGHVVRFDDQYFLGLGVVGVVLVQSKVSPFLKSIPPLVEYGDVSVVLYLVIFITENEYMCWRDGGHNELMRLFQREDKDLVSLKISGGRSNF